MPIDDESLAEDVERMEQRRRDSLAFIRQRDAARVAGGEPIAGSAAADRHALLAEVARLAEEVERLRADLEVAESRKSSVIRDLVADVERLRERLSCGTAFLHLRGIIVKVASGWGAGIDGAMTTHDTLDAAWAALDTARKEGGE